MADRYRYDWLRIGLGTAALLMVAITLAAGRWELAIVNAICSFLLLGQALVKSYESVSRCPYCHKRYPEHVEGCNSWYWTAHWDG